MGNCGYPADIQCIQAWITKRLCVDRLSTIIDRATEILRVTSINKTDSDTQFGQCIMEKVVCAAVETGRRDDLVTRLRNIQNRQSLRCLSRSGC